MRIVLASLLPLLALAPTGLAAEPASGIRLAPHRAVYDLSLMRSGGARSVDSARGRIVFDFSGDPCKGWALQYRQVTVLESSESGTRTSDLRNNTFESGDGHSFHFRTQSDLNGSQQPAVDGDAERDAKGLAVTIKNPQKARVTAPGEVLFPAAHMRRLIEAAQAGERTVSVKVFDGSDDGRKIYDTLAVIGPRRTIPASVETTAPPAAEAPLREGAMATMPRWPVTLSYFSAGEEGERMPIYVLSFDLYENGVSGALRLDYGGFALKGDLSRIDLAPEAKDCRP
ncbi:cell envelope integrity EipB family protein [Methylobacterium sp. ID0610]|uniref:cell envelope integrity EipB family protein n=1 Tax=Methylobacterium carpenticola TaxID=3344827 RepID=UPI0036D0AA3D